MLPPPVAHVVMMIIFPHILQGNSMSMVYYDLPIFALGSEEEVNETINVCA